MAGRDALVQRQRRLAGAPASGAPSNGIDGCTAGDIVGDTERAVGTAVTWPVLRLTALEVGLSASVERSRLPCSSRHQIKSASKSVTTTAATIELRVILPRIAMA
jgi:hypothetical protein